VLLDLVAPDIDGFEVLNYLEETMPNVLPRVIVTTGLAYASSAADRVCAFLSKPVDRQQLLAALERCATEPSGRFDAAGEVPQLR
jgi:CheY-like chemotaxis protein